MGRICQPCVERPILRHRTVKRPSLLISVIADEVSDRDELIRVRTRTPGEVVCCPDCGVATC